MPQRHTGRIDKHGKGWRLQIKVSGERIRRTFPTIAQAERALAEILEAIDGQRTSALARRYRTPTVADLVNEYYERRKPYLEDSTQARYDNVLKKYVLPRLGSLDARDVATSPVLLQDFLDSIPWGSARKALEVIGPAFRMAHDNGLTVVDPVTKIRRPKRPDGRRKKEIPTPDDVEKMIVAAYEEDVWWGYFVELTATLGTRRAETAALRWEDFEFPSGVARYGRIHIRRAVGKRAGGIYLKAPKSGQERELLVSRSLFDGLEGFDGAEGWLFPGRSVTPRRNGEISARSTPGRLLVWLHAQGGRVACASGRAGAQAREAIGTNSATFSQAMRELMARRLVKREANARRTFMLELTEPGVRAALELKAMEGRSDMPTHPDTVGHRFGSMLLRIGLRAPGERSYTLHSLRHYRATHLYNRSKDWVQVARYLGHTSPSITMELYANNVVSPTQELLADAAVDFGAAR